MAYRMLLMALLALGCSKAYVKSYNRGVDYLNMGLEEEAIREFQEALKQKHDYPDAHYGLGMSYLELDEPEEALKHLKEALKLDPDDPKYLWACGLAFYELGRYEEAAECLEKSYRLRPDWECAYNLGVVLRELGRYGIALERYLPFKRHSFSVQGLRGDSRGVLQEALLLEGKGHHICLEVRRGLLRRPRSRARCVHVFPPEGARGRVRRELRRYSKRLRAL
ncbi:MAG: hypothetical protein DRP94_09250 [Candidatus Latescibacterota bacterium]|nr:MAG: hypothetical protein DRP94_09250 [Candidatus Latescibacterota bacterium]